MLHDKAITPQALELLKELMRKAYLQQFVLVGGTALALQIGHRKSIDLDLFTSSDFDTDELLPKLLNSYPLRITLQMPQTLLCDINGVKTDFIRFKYPFNYPFIVQDGIRLLAIEDIAPMKLDAISGRGSKKDFFDLYYLFQKYSLEQMFNLYKEKYPHQTTFHVARSLTYFEDAENNPDPIVFDKKVTWEIVKEKMISEVQKL